jgi:uncharacterized Tic20 family protein
VLGSGAIGRIAALEDTVSDNALQTWGAEVNDNERMMALIAHLSGFVFPFLGPLLLWLLKKDDSRFVAYHSIQALVFQVIAWAVSGVTCGIGLVLFVLPILVAIKANKGRWEGYPLIDGIGRGT